MEQKQTNSLVCPTILLILTHLKNTSFQVANSGELKCFDVRFLLIPNFISYFRVFILQKKKNLGYSSPHRSSSVCILPPNQLYAFDREQPLHENSSLVKPSICLRCILHCRCCLQFPLLRLLRGRSTGAR